jgi:cytochrome c peroxidase
MLLRLALILLSARTPAFALRTGWLLLVLVQLNGVLPATAQSLDLPPAARPEPITPIPPPAVLDPQRVALGEQLFQDQRLSHDNTHSCGSCHDTRTNGASANALDLAADGRLLPFNTPTVFNAALNFRLNWEGNLRTLEAEAEHGLLNPAMMSSAEEVVGKLRADTAVVRQFRDAYGRDPDIAALLNAVATYERSLTTPGSRFDRWLAGETNAITSEELSGYQLFKSFGCISCHQGVNVGKRGKTRGTGMIIRFPRRHESDSLRACRLPTSMAFHAPI